MLLAIFIFEDVTFSTGARNLVRKLKCVVLLSYIGFILAAEVVSSEIVKISGLRFSFKVGKGAEQQR